MSHVVAHCPMCRAFKAKDPRGFVELAGQLAQHSGTGPALTMLNVRLKRPTPLEI
jgi:hypothetical protein